MGSLEVGAPDQAAWAGRRVLVTGAAGLLGGWVTSELCATGASVYGLDIAWPGDGRVSQGEYQAVSADVRDQETVAQLISSERLDTVIHLAAQTLVGPAVDDPVATFSHNIAGTWSVLEACRTTGSVQRIVVASSDKAYGDAAGRIYREDTALRPRHPYDTSKAAADLLAQTYAHTYGLPVGITRCANLFGGGDLNWSRVVPGTIRSVLAGERPRIRSDGTPVRDYVFVRDAALGTLRLADVVGRRPDVRGMAFNFAAGHRLSVLGMVCRIVDLMGSSLEPEILDEARFEIPVQLVSSARAKRELGWHPQTSLTAGLKATIAWYRVHLLASKP